jgi:Helix-turn-helix domain
MPINGYYATAEAAEVLGLSQSALKDAARRGALQVVQIAGRNLITHAEMERYRRDHLGRGGWAARKAPGYEPNRRQSRNQRAYRERKKAARQQQPAN